MKKVRGSQDSLSINPYNESSKTQFFPVNIVNKNKTESKMENPTHTFSANFLEMELLLQLM